MKLNFVEFLLNCAKRFNSWFQNEATSGLGFVSLGPFTVRRFVFVYVFFCVCCMHVQYCNMVGGPGGIEAHPQDYYFLQCFDTVGWVI